MDTSDSPYSQFICGFANRLDINVTEADALVRSLRQSDTEKKVDSEDLDNLELLLAVSLNAKLRDAQENTRFKRLKFLLRNNNVRAVALAAKWVDHKISFEAMLAAV